jgi:probable rRNA maturation factor
MSEDPGSTSLEIAVVARDPLWREAEPRFEDLARRAAEAVFGHDAPCRGLDGRVEASIVLADDALVRGLNRTYRRQDHPTNVLSFSNDGQLDGANGPRLLGDVILARETVLREARDQGKTVGAHMSHLVVHGLLHLLGFDHEEATQAEAMEALEVAILARLGIGNPYSDIPLKTEPS